MDSASSRLKSQFLKPVINGGVSAVTLRTMIGDKRFNLFGKDIGILPFGFGLGFASQFSSELIANWILPYINRSSAATKFESMVLSIGANGASFAIIPKLLNGDVDASTMKTLFMAGAVSEAVSTYLYQNVLAGSGSIIGL